MIWGEGAGGKGGGEIRVARTTLTWPSSGGGRGLGRETAREWRRTGPSPSHAKKVTQVETKHQKMTGDRESHGEVERRGHQGDRGNNDGLPPRYQQGPGYRTRAARREEQMRDTTEEVDTRRGAQRRAAEYVGWRVG